MVDTWEAFQDYKRTAIVLDHFDHEINTVLGGAHTEDGEHRDVKVMLLAGSDLIGTMSEPGVWSYTDVGRIRKLQYSMLTVSVGVAGSHLRTLRHVYRGTSRISNGPSNRQPCKVARQHSLNLTTHTERRFFYESTLVPSQRTECKILVTFERSRLYRAERALPRGRHWVGGG
jgi:hypothetical protein